MNAKNINPLNRPKKSLKGIFLFFKEFWKNRRDVGSVIPSSPFLVNDMLKWVDFDRAKLVVELGPGEGCITHGILERLRPDAKLLVFEINETFAQHLKELYPDERMEIVLVSAEHLCEELAKRGYEKADFIVSGLPLLNFPEALRNGIWKAIQLGLKLKGCYVQYHFAPKFRSHYLKLFHQVHMGFTPLNILPAYVFTCTGPKI